MISRVKLLIRARWVEWSLKKKFATELFSLAKSRLGADEFSSLSQALPEVDGLLRKAGGLEIDSLLGLTKHLEGLGIEGGALKCFAPAVIDYVQETTDVSKAELLRKAMSLRSGL